MILQLRVLKEQFGFDSHNWPISRFIQNKWPLTRFIPGNSSALLHFVVVFSSHGQQDRLKGGGGGVSDRWMDCGYSCIWEHCTMIHGRCLIYQPPDRRYHQREIQVTNDSMWDMLGRRGRSLTQGEQCRSKMCLQHILLIDTCSGLCTFNCFTRGLFKQKL